VSHASAWALVSAAGVLLGLLVVCADQCEGCADEFSVVCWGAVGELEYVFQSDADVEAGRPGRGDDLPGPRSVPVPELRHARGDQPRDRPGVLRAALDLDQRPQDLMRE